MAENAKKQKEWTYPVHGFSEDDFIELVKFFKIFVDFKKRKNVYDKEDIVE